MEKPKTLNCRIVVLLTTLLLMLTFISAERMLPSTTKSGENGTLKGQITDAESTAPLAGCNVVIHGTLLGAATDLNGCFEIANVPAGSIRVIIRSTDYKTDTLRTEIHGNEMKAIQHELKPGRIYGISLPVPPKCHPRPFPPGVDNSIDPKISIGEATNACDPEITLFDADNSMDPDISIPPRRHWRIDLRNIPFPKRKSKTAPNDSLETPQK